MAHDQDHLLLAHRRSGAAVVRAIPEARWLGSMTQPLGLTSAWSASREAPSARSGLTLDTWRLRQEYSSNLAVQRGGIG